MTIDEMKKLLGAYGQAQYKLGIKNYGMGEWPADDDPKADSNIAFSHILGAFEKLEAELGRYKEALGEENKLLKRDEQYEADAELGRLVRERFTSCPAGSYGCECCSILKEALKRG